MVLPKWVRRLRSLLEHYRVLLAATALPHSLEHAVHVHRTGISQLPKKPHGEVWQGQILDVLRLNAHVAEDRASHGLTLENSAAVASDGRLNESINRPMPSRWDDVRVRSDEGGPALPESRHKYLYERLGDYDFQQLVGALLSLRFPDFVPLPLGQADGGRDGVRVTPAERLVYQVKWSATGTAKDPVSWLDAAIVKESAAIRRFAKEGTNQYVLVTNVPSTGRRGSGTFDRLNAKLSQRSHEYGIEITVLWREAINPMVDSAPTELKWSYAEMLAGWDLVRYLVSEQADAKRDSDLRNLLLRVAAAQWAEDRRIKFSQAELDRELLTDLFVDVPAERIQSPRRALVYQRDTEPEHLGGAAAYLTGKTPYPFALVRGVPGQGKSTLSQLVCQAFRVAFMPQDADRGGLPRIKDPRFPVRFDLAKYSTWMQGFDVFDESDSLKVKRGKKRPAADATIECFLAYLMSHAGGNNQVTAKDIQDLLERVPALIVMDGLDEVGGTGARKQIVREIDLFCSRGRTYAVEPKVVVTTRPNSAGLPEPDLDTFEVISLGPLDHALRDQYLRKWCAVHNVKGEDNRNLRRNFNEKIREPYIGELAGNPMQLTILLFLLRQSGDATPSQRTELYDAYMGLLLAREANKHPDSVRKHRAELVEIIPFLGWYIQSRAEEQGHSGRMSIAEVKAAMKHFQRSYEKQEKIVDELFLAATDRLWALTSKEEGAFEFEVLSLREYFAARYLYRCAGEGDHRFDRTVVLRELLQRPYWLNTTRFYAGNAAGADIYVLEAGIQQELAANPSKQVRVATWSLITDGVFNSRPTVASGIVDKLVDDTGSDLLLEALDGKEITALPDPTHAAQAWARLTAAIEAEPSSPNNHTRVRVLRDLLHQRSQFRDWWTEHLKAAVGTPDEVAWLAIGAQCEVLAGETIDVPGLSADDGHRAQLILNTGSIAPAGSHLERQLLDAVLDGHCTETTSIRSTHAQIAVALNPAEFYTTNGNWRSASDRRPHAIQLLRKSTPPYANVAGLRRFRRGERGTTFPWSRTAQALIEVTGRCWLAAEITVIGAASSHNDGYSLLPDTKAFGPNSHPATLIALTRRHKDDSAWWLERLTECTDDLSQAEWALAVEALASGNDNELHKEREKVVNSLPERLQRALRSAEHRMQNAHQDLVDDSITSSPGTMPGNRAGGGPGATTTSQRPPKAPEALAAVARREKWLKVDQVDVYR